MDIKVEITEEDADRFYKEYGFSRNWLGKTLVMLLIDLIICAYLQIFVLPMIVYGIILFVFFFVIPYYVTQAKLKRTFQNDPAVLGKKTYKPFVSGIEITNEEGDTFLRYESIKKIGTTRNYVFIILLGGNYCLLPKWSFSSFSDINRLLQLVRNGIGTVKGVKVKEPFTFKPIYMVGLICLIPLIGAIAGIIFIILGIAHYRDRVFIVIGAIGIVITVAVYGSLFYVGQNLPGVKKGFADIAQMQLNDLVKSVEFYKLQHGAYPDSLKQVADKNSTINIYDVSQGAAEGKDLPPFHYKKIGNRYLLFSPGLDGIVNTPDDIYPTLINPDTNKLGFIRKK